MRSLKISSFFLVLNTLLILTVFTAFLRYIILEKFIIYDDENTIPAGISRQLSDIQDNGL